MDTLVHEVDELVSKPSGEKESHVPDKSNSTVLRTRNVNLILDHSAFVKGIGNVKRWFNFDYVKSNLKEYSQESVKLNIFIPTYALHEFDYVKKGPSMMATNAREAIKFIDKYVEDKLCFEESGENSFKIEFDLEIESPMESTPSWRNCLDFKLYSPKVQEFPNCQTDFQANTIFKTQETGSERNYPKGNTSLGLDDNSSLQNPNTETVIRDTLDEFAIMPPRLKYLIRSCIQKRYHSKNNFEDSLEEWKLVTEDNITKIWVSSFGIDCMNVNEAELLIFNSYDTSRQTLDNPQSSFNVKDDDKPFCSILQKTIDTTAYEYSSFADKNNTPKFESHSGKNKKTHRNRRGPKKDKKKKKRAEFEGKASHLINQGSQAGIPYDTSYIRVENFDMINYAPRGTGELWKA